MKENGKLMLPTAEEAEVLTPTIRKEMTARGATKVSITYNRIAGLKAMGTSRWRTCRAYSRCFSFAA